mmetsp:Transcript_73777/g.192488  ORF Transcript_73777/g.192488 Transcript_73777/m.192488 type:complete len:247 (+) Transcript_73777:738-1478(+)
MGRTFCITCCCMFCMFLCRITSRGGCTSGGRPICCCAGCTAADRPPVMVAISISTAGPREPEAPGAPGGLGGWPPCLQLSCTCSAAAAACSSHTYTPRGGASMRPQYSRLALCRRPGRARSLVKWAAKASSVELSFSARDTTYTRALCCQSPSLGGSSMLGSLRPPHTYVPSTMESVSIVVPRRSCSASASSLLLVKANTAGAWWQTCVSTISSTNQSIPAWRVYAYIMSVPDRKVGRLATALPTV